MDRNKSVPGGLLHAGLAVLLCCISVPVAVNARQGELKPCRSSAKNQNCQPLAPTAGISAQPASITLGQSTTLSWTSQNATTLDLEPGIGTVAAQGSVAVTPQQTTTYTLTVTGSGGTVTASTTVSVTQPVPAPTATLAATPTAITVGQSSTLSWTSQNATTLDLEP